MHTPNILHLLKKLKKTAKKNQICTVKKNCQWQRLWRCDTLHTIHYHYSCILSFYFPLHSFVISLVCVFFWLLPFFRVVSLYIMYASGCRKKNTRLNEITVKKRIENVIQNKTCMHRKCVRALTLSQFFF